VKGLAAISPEFLDARSVGRGIPGVTQSGAALAERAAGQDHGGDEQDGAGYAGEDSADCDLIFIHFLIVRVGCEVVIVSRVRP
jgi:hypothetical protein